MSISDADTQAIMVRWTEILEAQGADQRLTGLGVTGAKDIFCKDWPIAKPILEALLPLLPLPLRIVVNAVIALADAVYKTVCPAK